MSEKVWHSAKYDPPKLSRYSNHPYFLTYTKSGAYVTAKVVYNSQENMCHWVNVQNDLFMDGVEYWMDLPKKPCKENIKSVQLSKDRLTELVEKINSMNGISEEVLKALKIGNEEDAQ